MVNQTDHPDTNGFGRAGCGEGPYGAPPKKLYRVGEIAEHLGLTRQTIHNYATIGLITEERRTAGGQKLFDESVFAVLGRIQRLKARHRLAEIRRLLQHEAEAEIAAASPFSKDALNSWPQVNDNTGCGPGPRHVPDGPRTRG